MLKYIFHHMSARRAALTNHGNIFTSRQMLQEKLL